MSLYTLNNNIAATYLLNILNQAGNQARFIGGCVRDAYIDRDFTDIDIATTLLPEQTLKILNYHNIKAIKTGINFGTITALHNKQAFEITTLRRDLQCDGRHAKVEFTDDWEEDAARRDFTINAMSYSLSGTIYDYFNGINDLKYGVIKFVGDPQERISEDYLRILRLFRFFTYYGKTSLDSATLVACQNNIHGINILSGERIQNEMYKILKSINFDQVLHLMHKINILTYLINNPNINFNHLHHLSIIEQNFSLPINIIRRLAATLYEAELSMINHLIERWKLSEKDQNRLRILSRPKFTITGKETPKDLYKMIRLTNKEYVYDLILLRWSKIRDNNFNDIEDRSFFSMINIVNDWNVPKLPINGQDLLKLGIPQGEKIGQLLQQAINFWEENNYNSTKDEIINEILLKR